VREKNNVFPLPCCAAQKDCVLSPEPEPPESSPLIRPRLQKTGSTAPAGSPKPNCSLLIGAKQQEQPGLGDFLPVSPMLSISRPPRSTFQFFSTCFHQRRSHASFRQAACGGANQGPADTSGGPPAPTRAIPAIERRDPFLASESQGAQGSVDGGDCRSGLTLEPWLSILDVCPCEIGDRSRETDRNSVCSVSASEGRHATTCQTGGQQCSRASRCPPSGGAGWSINETASPEQVTGV
jgi:hypothetical protein